ncbi:putative E3 ubiquitin-protein ligase ipaH7.8 [Pseudomonas extremaustralis]|uniref:RING-type E3 ubiquitin transferase n=2 Tax=Pseudomonas extremaustralis TaxID=359110 RepID=A0A5M9IUV6_9PSED|nr:putative E3 ubiquitin-protein ligase ipaH7.8 [Pseudomonas extremaustralis]
MSTPVISSTLPEGTFTTDLRGVHYDFLKDRIPSWFNQASSQRQAEFANHELHQLPSWYRAASPEARSALAGKHSLFRETLNTVENSLGRIADVLAFAEKPLKEAIKKTFNLDLDVRSVYFARKYAYPRGRSDLYGTFSFEQQSDPTLNYRYRAVSLLEAALANFEPDEELPPSCDDCQIITTFDGYDGEIIPTFEAISEQALAIAPHAFAKLCRTLDLGSLYQQHLKTVLEPQVVVERVALDRQLQEHHRQRLAVSVEIAHLQFAKSDRRVESGISDDAYRMLKHVLADQPGVTLDGRPVTFAVLKAFGSLLVGPLLIGPDRQGSDRVERLVVYIPNDPQQPLKEYASSADFMADLRTRLHSASYRRFFSRFVPQREQGVFFKQFNRLFQPTDGTPSSADYPLKPEPGRVPLREAPITGNLWEQLSKAFSRKVYSDARAVAVPTGDEDLKARNERLESYLDAVVSALNLAAFVVPGLGPIMLAVGAAQMCYETFEGIEAYEQGDIKGMWAHVSSVALNVAFFAAGAKVLPRIKSVNMLDSLKPVTMPSGERMLWKADLGPYESAITLDPASKPDGLGLHRHKGQALLALEGKHYEVRQDAATGQYRIRHPSRRGAYEPKLEHNHQGAWSHEVEEPLTWDEPTLLRRLGLVELSDQVRISGVEPQVLREAVVDHEFLPLVLDETIKRFQIHQHLTTFVEQMNSVDPLVYAKADPALQLDIMQRRGLLSETPPLRVLDNNANILWESAGAASTQRRVVALSQGNMDRGELLNEVLYTLQGVDPALPDIPGSPQDSLQTRAGLLRTIIGSTVGAQKGPMMDERYSALTRTPDPDVHRLLADYPKLSTPMAAHMLENLEAGDLQRFRNSGRLPQALAEQMRWCEQETRVTRAYEGLHLDTLADIDSQRLALRTLETLPGWRRGTRVELRQYSAQGLLLDAIGAPDAALGKTLVLHENGLFSAQGPGDFYTAAWEAMSPAERQSMGVSDASQLKQAIQHAPLPRAALRTVLLEHPVRKPAYDPSMRLFGGGPGFRQLLARTGQALRSSEARVRKLFPSFNDAHVSEFIQSLGPDVSGRLAAREAEFETLDRALKVWVKENAPQSTRTEFDRAGGLAGHTANEIRRCWRRETGGKLSLVNGKGTTLPALSADFGHVETLELSGFNDGGNVQALLENFSGVKALSLRNCKLTEIPRAVVDMPGLRSLSLESNPIRFTPQSAATLGALTALDELSLMGCPLGTPLDFSTLPRLKRLNLSSTQMEQWPTGLQHQASLEILDLRNNRLREVPQANLNPPPEQLAAMARINRVTLLGNNAFPENYWQQFDRYWKHLGETQPDLLPGGLDGAFDSGNPKVAVVRKMYPSYSVQKAREFIWNLGGGAEAELARLEQAFDLLQAQLEAWTFSGGGAYQRYVRPGERGVNTAARRARNEAQQRILSCWRRETPQKLANDGTPIGLELDLSDLPLPSLPDLDTDFSHVGSLKLSNMGLTTSPEGFLSRYRGVRWLDLSGNQLRELPPALGEMHGLTRLFLQNNRIRLSPETARILSERVSLRALIISGNDLRLSPDFSQITDMRSLSMARAGLETWPAGLAEQPLLDGIDLSGNQLTTIPASVISPSDERLAQTARVNNVTIASDNPWSDATLQQVSAYAQRLEQAGLAAPENPNRLVASVALRSNRGVTPVSSDAPFQRWTAGLSQEQAATRKAQWNELRGKAGADGFFEVLRDLELAGAGHEDLQRRVWEVIDTITANSVDSESLREQMFEWAGRPACCDRAALSFSNLEVMAMVHRARLQAMDSTQGVVLSTLSRGLFRLDQVEKAALIDIDQRRAAINSNPAMTAAQKTRQLELLEEVEIRLAYRYGLKDRLQLPGQPQQVRFTALGKVTPAMLDAAYEKIVALDHSPEAFQALLSRTFWQDYVTNKYRPQFEAQSKPYQEKLAVLFERFSDGRLESHAYERQAGDLQARLTLDDAALIDRLSRQEIAEHLISQAPLQALTEPAVGRVAALRLSEAKAIEFDGKPYFIASMPDAGDGQYYLLRVQSERNPYELVSSGIVAKPDVAGIWKRRGQAGGRVEDVSDDEYESASELMPVTPYSARELSDMRREVHFATVQNTLGSYNRVNNGKYPLRDLQGRPIRIRGLEKQVRMPSGHTYTSTPIKPYIKFEGYEDVAALYDEKLQWRTFTVDDVSIPGERALIGQSMVTANRRIAKGEIVGLYGGVILPRSLSVASEGTYGMVVGATHVVEAGTSHTVPLFIEGDSIISRINTHFEYDASGKPIRQAAGGYNVESVPFTVEAEHATSRPGVRANYVLNAVFATEDIPAGVELRLNYEYTEEMIKAKFA